MSVIERKPIGRIVWENVPASWLADDDDKSSTHSQITDDEEQWEEVYNFADGYCGEPREYCGQPGIFYQTYGNGGGRNGWGGYWVRADSSAIWSVAGSEFKYLDIHEYEVREADEKNGICSAIRIIKPTKEDGESVSTDGCPTCDWCSEDMPNGGHLMTDCGGDEVCRSCAKKYDEEELDIQPASVMAL